MKKINLLFIEFIKEYKVLFFIYMLTLVYIPINSIYIPKLYGNLISDLKSKKLKNVKKQFCILICGWLLIQLLSNVSGYIISKLMPKFKQSVRGFLIEEIMDKFSTSSQNLKIGDIITKIIKTPYILGDVFWVVQDIIITNIITVLSVFGYLYYYNKKLGIVFALFIVILVVLSYLYVCKFKDNIMVIETLYDNTHEEIEDTFSNLISIYTSRRYKYEKERMNNIDEKLYDNIQQLNRIKNKFRIIYTFIFMIFILYLNYTSYDLFLNKKLSIETFISVFIINYSLLGIFISFFKELNEASETYVGIDLIIDFIENKLPKKIKESSSTLKVPILPHNNKGIKIEFKDVKFKYENTKQYILNGINLTIEPLDTVIIKGHIGSGKSTIVKLILKFINGYEGTININGLLNKKISIEDLRANIMYIPQHPSLFNRTLRANLLYGVNKNITIKKIFDVLVANDMTDLKNKFESVLDDNVGKLGGNLAGGQGQIVWILRSIFNDSKMIIFDEPTSSLDSETKNNIIKLIKTIKANKNILIITHDNDIIEDTTLYDKIIELKDGIVIT